MSERQHVTRLGRVGIVAAGVVAALGLTACAQAGSTGDGAAGALDSAAETAVEVAAELSPEGAALAALGYDPADIAPALAADPAPVSQPSAGPQPGASQSGKDGARPWRQRHKARVLLRRNTLHGEAVVRTKDGTTKTVVVQRGEVTALDGNTITVKSSDGFTQTWTFGEPLRVVERRSTVQPEDVAVGAQVGVAGARDGDRTIAHLLLVR